MAKVSAKDIAAKARALYGPKDKNRGVIGTGETLKRPTNPEDFICMPEDHPWRRLTGLMGVPYDIITQVAGAPDSGKSTLAGQAMAAAQKQGAYVILWDTEKKFDSVRYERHFGGSAGELLTVQSTIIRSGAGAVFKYITSIAESDKSAKILIVHDSVGGSVSRSRAERDIDDEKSPQPASEAVENSDYMKHMVSTMDKHPGQIALLLINQMTDKIGPMPGKSRSGGHKITFHSSLIIEMTRVQDVTKVKAGVKLKTGIISRAKIAKNHLNQTENSVHEMRVSVDASGWHNLDGGDDEDSET